jgi:hypothetical protein
MGMSSSDTSTAESIAVIENARSGGGRERLPKGRLLGIDAVRAVAITAFSSSTST